MRKKYVTLGIMFALLLGSAAAYVATGLRLFGQYQVAYASYRISCDTLITWAPPQQIYTAFYTNEPSLLTLRYRDPAAEDLRLALSIPGFTQEQAVQVHAEPTFQSQSFKPPLLDAHVLDTLVGKNDQQTQIHLRVTDDHDDHAALCDTSVPLTLKSRQWMHWSAQGTEGAPDADMPYLAGWVTPQSPAITQLIGHTATWLGQHPSSYPEITSLSGYDEGRASSQVVREQVDAIFDTLQFVYHMHYAQDNIPFGSDQIIQLPQDVLASPQPVAMCVETTAIMASAVEHLGMRPFIVIVPGHAFLGVALGATASAPIEYWETSDLNGGVSGAQANLHGDNEFASAQHAGSIMAVVDIAAERAHGIHPIE